VEVFVSGGSLRGTRAVLVAGTAVAGGVALVLPTAHSLPGKLPADDLGPELSLALRIVCAVALAAAFALAWVTLKRHSDEPLAFAMLPGLVIAGIAVRYLLRTLPAYADEFPAAGIGPALGAWLLLGVGALLTVTGLAAGFALKRR
jgi:drug/metabolite transporter (DMT)-like permease